MEEVHTHALQPSWTREGSQMPTGFTATTVPGSSLTADNISYVTCGLCCKQISLLLRWKGKVKLCLVKVEAEVYISSRKLERKITNLLLLFMSFVTSSHLAA